MTNTKAAAGAKGLAVTVGTLTSAGLAALTGEPISSSVAGSILGVLLDDLGMRVLSHRERTRIKTAVSFAALRIQERWTAGEDYREDNFFDANPDNRSFFEEIAEGVLLTAQREYEERKIRHLGYLIANLAYEGMVDRATANWALRTASDLSWTQYLLITIVGRPDKVLPDVQTGVFAKSWESWSIHEELTNLGLFNRELLHAPSKEMRAIPSFNTNAAELELRPGAHILYELLMLEMIDDKELDDLIGRMMFE